MTIFRKILHPTMPRTVHVGGRTVTGRLAPSDVPEAFEVVVDRPQRIEVRFLYPYGNAEPDIVREISDTRLSIGANSGRLLRLEMTVSDTDSVDIAQLVAAIRNSIRNMKGLAQRAGSVMNYQVAEEELGVSSGSGNPLWLVDALKALRGEQAEVEH